MTTATGSEERFGYGRVALAMVFAASCLGWATAARGVVDIPDCHVYVHDGEVGVLTQDLVCLGNGEGIVLGDGATLQLAGHTISGPPPGSTADHPYYTVACYEYEVHDRGAGRDLRSGREWRLCLRPRHP